VTLQLFEEDRLNRARSSKESLPEPKAVNGVLIEIGYEREDSKSRVFVMMIALTCTVCGLQAKHQLASGTAATTTFDSTAFREKCAAPHASKSFDCPNLNKTIAAAGREGHILSA
jgi:hypothetical protein